MRDAQSCQDPFARLEQLLDGDAPQPQQVRHAARFDLVVAGRDECATGLALAQLDEPGHLEGAQRLAQCGPTNSEQDGKLAFRGESIAGCSEPPNSSSRTCAATASNVRRVRTGRNCGATPVDRLRLTCRPDDFFSSRHDACRRVLPKDYAWSRIVGRVTDVYINEQHSIFLKARVDMAGPAAWSDTAPVPAHVPADLVFDFDVYNAAARDQDFHLALKRLHEPDVPEVFWTPRKAGTGCSPAARKSIRFSPTSSIFRTTR